MRALVPPRRSTLTLAVILIGLLAFPLLAVGDDSTEEAIDEANDQIDRILDEAERTIEHADSHAAMVDAAEAAETDVFAVIDALEAEIGPVDFQPFYVTVCNDDIGKCVTFDPVRITGSGKG